jgi:nucleoside-diphosphate-sugar epimerase
MRTLVTGGSGFIGSHVIRALVARGDNVRALVRNTSDVAELERLGVELFHGDLTDESSLERIAEGVTHVIHLAGLLGGAKVPEEKYWDVNVTGTANLLAQFNDGSLERFVHCSTTGVLGPIAGPPADESCPVNPSNLYELTKSEGEVLAKRYGRDAGVPVLVIRPGMVYGPGNLHLLGLFRTIKKGLFFLIGTGESLLDPVYIDDVVQSLLLALDCPQAVGGTYIIAGERAVTVAELAQAIGKALGKKPYRFRVPVWAATWIARCSERLGNALGFDPRLTLSRVRFFTETRAYRIDRARDELGYCPRVPIEEGIQSTVLWYQAHGYL